MTRTPLEIKDGWLAGNMIRRARKPFTCGYWRGKLNGGFCKHVVQRGELYAEGEGDPYNAGGFGRDRYCLDCAGPEARAVTETADVQD